MRQHRPCGDLLRQQMQKAAARAQGAQGLLPEGFRGCFYLQQALYVIEGIAKKKPRPLQCPEQIAEQGEGAMAHPGKEQRRTGGGIDAALNGRYLQEGIGLYFDAQQSAGCLQFANAFAKVAVSHGRSPVKVIGAAS